MIIWRIDVNVYDTSALIEILEGGERGEKIKEIQKGESISTTAICVHEILSGAQSGHAREFLIGVLKKTTVLPFDMMSAMISSRIEDTLSRKGQKVRDADLFIASICIFHDATLITCDKDFQKVEGLKIEIF